MKFTFVVKQSEVDHAFEHVVDDAIKHTVIKGFRKGHAPRNTVIAQLGEARLQQEAIERALPEAFTAEVKKRQLKLVGYPDIKLKKGSKDSDWEFEADVAEMPEVKLNDYQKDLKGLFAKDKIWTPDKKGKPEVETKGDKADEDDRKLQMVLEQLLKLCEVEVPQLLIDQEVNRHLSRLVDQTTKLGLEMDAYLSSTGKTRESLKEEYTKVAVSNLRIEFILQAVGDDLKVEVGNDEIDKFIAVVGDEKTQQRLSSASERANLRLILFKRKTVEKLMALAA